MLSSTLRNSASIDRVGADGAEDDMHILRSGSAAQTLSAQHEDVQGRPQDSCRLVESIEVEQSVLRIYLFAHEVRIDGAFRVALFCA